MASSTTTSPTSGVGWIHSLQWVSRLSANISSFFPPTKPITKPDNERARQPRSQRTRPTTWHVSSDTLIFPQLDVPATAPAPLRESSLRRNKKELPPMPTGEHNVAARSRLRNKAERRPNRSRSRRPELNPTQSLRSSRRHSSASQSDVPQILSAEQIQAQKQRNRKSSPLPLPPVSQVMSVGNLKQPKELNRRSSPLPMTLEAIPASPDVPLFNDTWTSHERQCMERAALCSRQRRACNIDKLLVSPKTRFPKPIMLSPPLKSSPTTCKNSITVSRKKRDIAHVPASAKWYLWQILIDEKAPLVLTNIRVDRRYSDGRPSSGWSIDTPTPRKMGMPTIPRLDWTRAQSREFQCDIYGRRKYDRDSGFWQWTGSLL